MRAILIALIGSFILVVASCAPHNGGVGNGGVNSPQNSLSGKLKTVDDGTHLTTYGYDLFGRVQEIDVRLSSTPASPPIKTTKYSYVPLNQPTTITAVTTTPGGAPNPQTYVKIAPLVWQEWGQTNATLVRDPQGHTTLSIYANYTDKRQYVNGNLQLETQILPPNGALGGSLTSKPDTAILNSPENDGSDLVAGVRSVNVPMQWTEVSFTGLPPTVNFAYTLYNTGQVHTKTATGTFANGSSYIQNVTYTYYP